LGDAAFLFVVIVVVVVLVDEESIPLGPFTAPIVFALVSNGQFSLVGHAGALKDDDFLDVIRSIVVVISVIVDI
jgi:hypothetical protein